MAATVISLCLSGPTLAVEPDDTYIPPRTPAQAHFEELKLAYVVALKAYSPPPIAVGAPASGAATTNMLCSADCGDGGSGTDPDEPGPGTGTTGGTTGFVAPRTKVVLDVHARRQSTSYWCGPASGQVVINYSRGYDADSLNGDSTTTNWRSQATIANWMKTTQSTGTLGGNLAAALNRADAVVKPVAEWSYLYAKNADGEDLHGKVVADVHLYEMPLVIAVKPHKVDAEFYLPSWPREAPGAKHWVVIYGYDGLWDGTKDPTLYYADSSGNGSKSPGLYEVSSLIMWKVNEYNASTIVW